MRVFYISEIQWLSQPSRKHHLVRRFPSDWEILFTSPMNATRDENSLITRRDRGRPNVQYASLLLPKPDAALPLFRGATAPLTTLGGRSLLRRAAAFRPDVAVVSYLWAVPIVPALKDAGIPVVYDVNDLHYEFYPARRDDALRMFRSLVAEADEVVCSSSRLREVTGRGIVIGNGVDLDAFVPGVDRPLPGAVRESALSDCSDLIAYVGSVDDRIDFPILEAVLEAVGSLERRVGVMCVGRVFDSGRSGRERLEGAFPNGVLFTGRAPYDELPGYLAHAKVGIAPFVLSEKTRAINPNKLYMYAAMEENIVSTPFSKDIEAHADLIYVASGPDAFAQAAIAALGDEDRRRAVRERIAVPNGWDRKAEEFARLLARVVRRD